MSDITILEESQILGNDQLEIFKKYGAACAITDFSILLGGHVSQTCYTSEGISLKDRIGWYWSKTAYGFGSKNVRVIDDNCVYPCCVFVRSVGTRTALSSSILLPISSNQKRDSMGILEVEYGEYPQTIASGKIEKTLEKLYSKGLLASTGKKYTVHSKEIENYYEPFRAKRIKEYEYNGDKYVRMVGECNFDVRLSDGRRIEEGKQYWIKVEPIVWQVDEIEDIAVTKKLIFSGVQFDDKEDDKIDFSSSHLKKFIDNYFSKEISTDMDMLNSKVEKTKNRENETNKNPLKKSNPYNSSFNLCFYFI